MRTGCRPSPTPTAVTGKIALVQRGTCPFGQKVTNAEAAGAIGAVVMNQGNGDPVLNSDRYDLFGGTLGGPVGIPAVSVSYYLGEEFANTAGLVLRIEADTISTIRSTSNVLAQSRSGRTDNVVMAGAHLDSEPDTAGINDNGSGSIALLEIAKLQTPNAVRFAWWGAEESNLQGSTFYVNNLTAAQRADIALYLNFDMIASPNYTFGVYDGDDSAGEGSGPGPAGSAAIEDVFESFFAARGEATRAADFTGRSDYGPFIAVGIPAGGLFTGAETIKTARQEDVYGGTSGEPYDPCYHKACDDITNLSIKALDQMSDGVAHATLTYAEDEEVFVGPSRAESRSSAGVYKEFKGSH